MALIIYLTLWNDINHIPNYGWNFLFICGLHTALEQIRTTKMWWKAKGMHKDPNILRKNLAEDYVPLSTQYVGAKE